jgi:hypothetical protein
MFERKRVHIHLDQSESKIGVNHVKSLNAVTIAGKIVDHGSDEEVVGDVNASTEGQSFAIGYSKNVWVDGKRVY